MLPRRFPLPTGTTFGPLDGEEVADLGGAWTVVGRPAAKAVLR